MLCVRVCVNACVNVWVFASDVVVVLLVGSGAGKSLLPAIQGLNIICEIWRNNKCKTVAQTQLDPPLGTFLQTHTQHIQTLLLLALTVFQMHGVVNKNGNCSKENQSHCY